MELEFEMRGQLSFSAVPTLTELTRGRFKALAEFYAIAVRDTYLTSSTSYKLKRLDFPASQANLRTDFKRK